MTDNISPECVLEAARITQMSKGWFTIHDIYYGVYNFNCNALKKVINRKTSTYFRKIVKNAGAVSVGGKAGYIRYRLPEVAV